MLGSVKPRYSDLIWRCQLSSEDQHNEDGVVPAFAEYLDMHPGISADDVGSATMNIQDHHLQESGVVQGGLVATLADYALYRAVKTRLDPGQRSVTVELKLNFIAPAKDGKLTATARVVSAGRRIIVADVDVTDAQQKLIARGLSTYLVLQAPPSNT